MQYVGRRTKVQDMVRLLGLLVFVGFVAVGLPLLATGCATEQAVGVDEGASAEAPEEVVSAFYNWYIDLAAFDPESGVRNNPLQDGAYADRPELSEALVQRIQAEVAAMSMGGGDPILCAQDVPTEITVGEPIETDGQATVGVASDLVGHSIQVELSLEDGTWKIVDIQCP